MSIKITSQKFKEGEEIPDRYACKGVNVSPPLEWSPVVDVVKYAIICEDPDAAQGIWTHWVIFNIPGDLNAVDEWIMEREETEHGAKQGLNDFGTVGYRGPCPPDGTHRYYYRIYALDSEIDLPSMITRAQLKKAMEGHIIDEGSLMGRYTR
ncbi:MAG: YbhB/YbcL family Raf kinase inhibitor-like protein [Methanobacterium sp.]|nr:YbhB/YbcL family Raf kinase inhibitor-like protein [Methanobacterium sp.]